ncbi:early nodulin-like protein 1 [Canna indica]|uniref:Early nodulin-like protein 1 n=1 Tax=Canna indica TaxID=4628 RepID=A0AAQ3L4V7_9LILI|nr:early nodulin-like protein 1 [Canna indica]
MAAYINYLLLFFLFLSSVSLLMVAVESSLDFYVGGSRGWTVPVGNETESYNQWAIRNRFHVGDSLHFEYHNDSVLVVDRQNYGECNTADPLIEYDDGDTTFRFDRYGFFYFISGEPGHCEAGQRLIVRVMVHPAVANSPGPAPSQQPGGGSSDSGSDSEPGPRKSDATAIFAGFGAIMAGLGVVFLF